jgi:hypothetical protein
MRSSPAVKSFFEGTKFAGGKVYFFGAEFTGGDVGFSKQDSPAVRSLSPARTSGSAVGFFGAEFAGGEVSFENAKVAGGKFTFDGTKYALGCSITWGPFEPPAAWTALQERDRQQNEPLL